MRLILVFLFCISGLFGQASLDDTKFQLFRNVHSSVNQNYFRLLNEGETADNRFIPFEFADWSGTTIHPREGEPIRIDSANIHVDDELLVFLREGKMFFIYPEKLEYAQFGANIYIPVRNGDQNKYAYMQLLVDGPMQLLRKKYFEKRKINNHPMGISTGIEKYKFDERHRLYYYDKEKETLDELPRKKKEFIRLFKRDRNRMVEFARNNNISTRNENDVIRMFEFYNSDL